MPSNEAFFRLHRGLPREAPGSKESTRKAIRSLPPLPHDPPIVLDMGCGPGQHTILLAQELRAKVTGIDIHKPFLDRLVNAAQTAGLGSQIDTWHGSMLDVTHPAGSVDLIWAEGSIYSVGVEKALCTWAPMLAPGGCVAFSELVWLTDDRPEAAERLLDKEYPDMSDIPGNRARISRCGYQLVHDFVLPESDWTTEYYGPLREQMQLLGEAARGDDALSAVLADAEAEIQLYEEHSHAYGYAFFIAQKPAEA